MFVPSKSKYRKAFKGRVKGVAKGGSSLCFGEFGLKAIEGSRVTSAQIEAARRSIARTMKRVGKVWIKIYPNVPVSKKPADVRMGKGKGSVEFWVFRVEPGRIIFELGDVPESVAREALMKAASKLPINCKFVCADSV